MLLSVNYELCLHRVSAPWNFLETLDSTDSRKSEGFARAQSQSCKLCHITFALVLDVALQLASIERSCTCIPTLAACTEVRMHVARILQAEQTAASAEFGCSQTMLWMHSFNTLDA